MVRTASFVIALMVLVPSLPAQAGSMHQSPELRHNQKRMCSSGKPMQAVRTGRTVLYSCS